MAQNLFQGSTLLSELMIKLHTKYDGDDDNDDDDNNNNNNLIKRVFINVLAD